jgi:aconitate hydratase
LKDQSRATIGLTGEETFEIVGLSDNIAPMQKLSVSAIAADGTKKEFSAICRIDTPVELEYYKNGGILQTVLRRILSGK